MPIPGQNRQPLTLMLLDAIRSMPSEQLCNVLYAGLADKPDIRSEDLEALANKLGRVAWEKARDEEQRHG